MYNPYDHYFKKAKKSGYVARSAFKLEEIDQKFDIFGDKVMSVIDVWCSPWSWLQYARDKLTHNKIKNKKNRIQVEPVLIWFDIKETKPISPEVFTYIQDIEDQPKIRSILDDHKLTKVDVIISDMAPNTTWDQSTDALRSIGLLESTLRMYEELLKDDWKFVIKVFMGPWFDQFRDTLKKMFWNKNIKVYKPKACRKNSKETYIVKI